MENSPSPMFENERTGLGRECEAILAVAVMQRLFVIQETNSSDRTTAQVI